jgi:hypothetical protein
MAKNRRKQPAPSTPEAALLDTTDGRAARALWLAQVATGALTETHITATGEKIKRPASLRDRTRAIELLGRMFGDYVERIEASGPNGGPIVLAEIPTNAAEASGRLLALVSRVRAETAR